MTGLSRHNDEIIKLLDGRDFNLLTFSPRTDNQMALQTRQNPETGVLEVLVDGEWTKFEDYRKKQIDDAYQSSVSFLRERLGEESASSQIKNSADETGK